MNTRATLRRHATTRLATSTLAALGALGIAVRQLRQLLADDEYTPEFIDDAALRLLDAELIATALSSRDALEIVTTVELADGTEVSTDLDCVVGATRKLLRLIDAAPLAHAEPRRSAMTA